MTLVQKRLLNLLVLSCITAGSGAGLYLYQRRQQHQEERQSQAHKLFDFSTSQNSAVSKEKIVSVTLQTPQGTFSFQRQDNPSLPWLLTQPLNTPADASTLEALVQAALDGRISRWVKGMEAQAAQDSMHTPGAPLQNLSLFGLDPPRYILTLETAQGQRQTLWVGSKNNFASELYVKRSDHAEVGLIPGSFEYSLDKDLLALRDKRAAVFNPEDVTQLQVFANVGLRSRAASSPSYTLQRREHGFVLTQPIQAPADETQVTTLLTALAGLRAKAFASEHAAPSDLPRFGLDKPRYRVILSFKKGPPLQLRLGEKDINHQPHHFAMQETSAVPPVVELGTDWAFKKLSVSAHGLRDLRVVVFERDQVEAITLGQGDQSFTLRKRSDPKKGTSGWVLEGARSESADEPALTALMYRLSTLKADHVVAEPPQPALLQAKGLSPPSAHVDLYGAEHVSLGSILLGHSEGGMRYVTTSAHQRLDTIRVQSLQDISFNLDDYKSK